MESGKRRTSIVLISDKLESLGYFQMVARDLPTDVLNVLRFPAALVVRRLETIEYSTNTERTSSFGLSIVLFLEAPTDMELAKCDIQDRVEEAMAELFVSSEWRGLNLQLLLDQVDAGPLALSAFGIEGAIFAPYGAVRMDYTATFDYVVG